MTTNVPLAQAILEVVVRLDSGIEYVVRADTNFEGDLRFEAHSLSTDASAPFIGDFTLGLRGAYRKATRRRMRAATMRRLNRRSP